MKTNINRSQRRKLPDVVMMIRPSPARGTERYSLMWKYERAKFTPMNSVAMVAKFSTKRFETDTDPQNLP